MNDIYFCTDIETNGPTPGHFSMLSFATVAFKLDETIIDTFERNLELLPNAKECPDTMTWWQTEQNAYEATRQNLVHPKIAFQHYVDWVQKLTNTTHVGEFAFDDTDKKPITLSFPATFDHAFMNWYLHEFIGYTPFYLVGFDTTSYAAAVLKKPFKDITRTKMPKHWIDNKTAHTHNAIDDAVGHAITFCRMVKNNREENKNISL